MNLPLSENERLSKKLSDNGLLIRRKNDAKKSRHAVKKQNVSAQCNGRENTLLVWLMQRRVRPGKLWKRGNWRWRRRNRRGPRLLLYARNLMATLLSPCFKISHYLMLRSSATT
jgi:hypothetical protein